MVLLFSVVKSNSTQDLINLSNIKAIIKVNVYNGKFVIPDIIMTIVSCFIQNITNNERIEQGLLFVYLRLFM